MSAVVNQTQLTRKPILRDKRNDMMLSWLEMLYRPIGTEWIPL